MTDSLAMAGTEPPRRARPPWRLLPWLAGLVTFVLALPTLGTRDLWLDEAFTVGAANQLPHSIIDRGGSMAIYYLLMGPWTEPSIDPAYLRLPSALFAAAGVATTVYLAQRMFAGRAGLFTAVVMVPSWGVLRYAQEVRSYSLVLLLAAASVLLLVLIRERGDAPQTGRWAMWGLIAALLVYAHPYGALVVLAQGLALHTDHQSLSQLLQQTKVGLGVFALAMAPMAWMIAVSREQAPGWIPPLGLHTFHSTLEMLAGSVEWAQVAIAVVLLFAAGAVARTATTRWEDRLLLLWCFVPVTVLLAMSLAVSSIVGRFLIGSLPAAVILIAVAIDRRLPGPGGLAAALTVMAILIPGHLAQHRAPGEPWSEAIDIIERASSDGRGHGVYFPDTWQRTVFRVNAEGRAILAQTEPVIPREPWSEILREYEPVAREAIEALGEQLDVMWSVYRDVTPWKDPEPGELSVAEIMANLGWCPVDSFALRDDVSIVRHEKCQ